MWRGVVGIVFLLTVAAACTDDAPPPPSGVATTPTTAEPPPTAVPATTSAATSTAPTTAPATTTPVATAPATTAPVATTAATQAADATLVTEIESALAAAPEGCDALDTRHCYFPFPSNAYTIADPRSETGRRVHFPAAAAPANASGVILEVAEWNRNDGFSPNSTILTYVEGIDPAASALPSWTDLDASLADDSPVVLVDSLSDERIPLWAEVDANADDAGDRALAIHPAVSLPEGRTYVIGLRGLVGRRGEPIEPSPVFRAFRDALITEIPAIEERRPMMEDALAELEAAGVGRGDLQLAWDFTVASTENLTARMLHIRDRTLEQLGNAAPRYRITAATNDPVDDDGAPIEGIARQITGTFTVPNWLTGDGSPGNGFNYAAHDPAAGPDALPAPNGIVQAPFACNIPDAVMTGRRPGRIALYGHGLLGSEMEINAGNLRTFANAYDTVFCATKWAGMSEDDIGNAVASLEDLSNFPTLVDRLQQGVLNQLVLSRLLLADDGLAADPALQRRNGRPLYDNSALVFDGNSQGGIIGSMLAAVSPDIERFVLGVPGINYGVLLPRSVDFETYETVFEPAYPNDLDRTLLLAMIQMLWDRGEGAGYIQHVVGDPLPGTPAKDVLLHVAFGDWQVSELTAFIAARTMGIPIHRPVAAPGRSREVEPGWGLDTLSYPSDGSGILVWDSGSDPIPIPDVAPSTSRDPHADPRNDPDVQRQKAAFLFGGEIIDICNGQACAADPSD